MIQLDVDFLSYDKIAREAYRFLLEFGFENSVPVPIENIVEYNLKADIVPIPGLQRIYDVDGATSSDLSTIYVDDFVYANRPTRYRFTLAHEAGHIYMHEKYFKQHNFDSIDGWKEFQAQIDEKDYSTLEFQGYAFGGLVLVPRQHLRPAFVETISKIQPMIDKAKSVGIKKVSYIDSVVDRVGSMLSLTFDVSPGVITRRINYDKLEGLIP